MAHRGVTLGGDSRCEREKGGRLRLWQQSARRNSKEEEQEQSQWAGTFPARITTIKTTARGRYALYLAEQYFDVFDAAIVDEFRLKQDCVVEEALMRQAQEAQRLRSAKERAYRLLSYRDHSERELYDKLCQQTSPQVAAQTIAQLVELGLLRDEEYANQLARSLMEQKCFSYRKSLYELKRKGVPEPLAVAALERLSVTPEAQIRRLFDKKYARRDLEDIKERKKIGDSLSRLGFSYEDIRVTMEAVRQERQEEQRHQQTEEDLPF